MQKVPFALLGSLAKIWPDLAPANKLPNITIVDPTTYASMSDTRRQSRIYVVLRPDDPKLLPCVRHTRVRRWVYYSNIWQLICRSQVRPYFC